MMGVTEFQYNTIQHSAHAHTLAQRKNLSKHSFQKDYYDTNRIKRSVRYQKVYRKSPPVIFFTCPAERHYTHTKQDELAVTGHTISNRILRG